MIKVSFDVNDVHALGRVFATLSSLDGVENLKASGSIGEGHKGEAELDDLDTLIVPARYPEGPKYFHSENAWQSVFIHESKRDKIRYVALYETKPGPQAVTYIAKVKRIVPSEEVQGKFRIEFDGKPEPVGPVPRGGLTVRGPRYVKRELLIKAKTLRDAS